jgi:hypothetical protein
MGGKQQQGQQQAVSGGGGANHPAGSGVSRSSLVGVRGAVNTSAAAAAAELAAMHRRLEEMEHMAATHEAESRLLRED